MDRQPSSEIRGVRHEGRYLDDQAYVGAPSVQTVSGLSARERANLLNRRRQLSSGHRSVLPRQFDYHAQRWC